MQQHSLLRVVSVNVGLPREVSWKGRIVSTGIFKEPVAGRVMAHRLNLEGDRQADLSVHGGPEKAIYVYPMDYYEAWRQELPEIHLPWGMFGENLTVEGVRDDTVHIGDHFRIGSGVHHSFLQKTLDDIPERYFPNPCKRRASLSSAATSQHGQITHSVRGRLLLVPLDAA